MIRMACLDEKIIPGRLALRKQSHQNIYDETVYAGEDTLHFIPTELFDGKAAVMLPASFLDMPDLLAEVKYPSVQRPQIIKMNQTGAVNFCFNLFESPIERAQVEPVCLSFRSALQKSRPSLMQMGQETKRLADADISWFEFRSYSLSDQIYNLLFVTSIGGKLMNGAMNCPANIAKEWKPIMRQVVQTIEDHTNDNKREEA